MRKIFYSFIALLAILLLNITGLLAQTNIANYTFSKSNGTYVPLTGGTVYLTAWDTESSAAIPLGGTFTFGGTSFTTCFIDVNGAISFGATSASSSILSTLGSTTGAIAAYTQDGANSTAPGSAPAISYGTVGNEFVVQYADH